MRDFDNSFSQHVVLQEGTAPTIQAEVDFAIEDETVRSTKPLSPRVISETGFVGADYVPDPAAASGDRHPKKSSLMLDDEPVYREASNEDYVSPEETGRRSSIRERLIQKYLAEIKEETKEATERFEKAVNFVDKCLRKGLDKLTEEQRNNYDKAHRIVDKGIPIDEAEMLRQAKYRAYQQVISSKE